MTVSACDWVTLANPGVQGLQPYQPGKPIEAVQRELGLTRVIKLASNESPLGPGEKARAACRAALDEAHRYPDASGYRLKQALAERLAVAPAQITLGSGSNDVLDLLGRVFLAPGRSAVFSEHAFIVYPITTRATGARAIVTPAKDWGHDLEAMAAAIAPDTRLVFIANPNNPTGTWVNEASLRAFLQRVSDDVLVVLDEAYAEYLEADDYPDGVALQREYPNLVVTRTFSKAWGLAGLRVGYAIASPAVTDLLNRVRMPFNVSVPALAAAEAALSDTDYLNRSRAVNAEGLAVLTDGLERLGLTVIPSVANFVAVRMPGPAAPYYDALLRAGVIVRPVGVYGMPDFLRISVGLPEENRECLAALAQVLEQVTT